MESPLPQIVFLRESYDRTSIPCLAYSLQFYVISLLSKFLSLTGYSRSQTLTVPVLSFLSQQSQHSFSLFELINGIPGALTLVF